MCCVVAVVVDVVAVVAAKQDPNLENSQKSQVVDPEEFDPARISPDGP